MKIELRTDFVASDEEYRCYATVTKVSEKEPAGLLNMWMSSRGKTVGEAEEGALQRLKDCILAVKKGVVRTIEVKLEDITDGR